MPFNIFQNQTKSVPSSDEQIVRVDMEQLDIGGRKSHLRTVNKTDGRENEMSVTHVPNAGSKS